MVAGLRQLSIFCLNMVQGLPASFFAIGLPALLREAGAGLDLVSLAYLMWAPWALKWLWGPLLDQDATLFSALFGRIAYLPATMAGSFLLLIAFPPSSFAWPIFVIGIACSFVGATLQMVLGRWIMAIEPDERGRARLNAMQVAGMITGAMIGGTLVVLLSDLLSWAWAVVSIVVLILLAGLPFLLTQQERIGVPGQAGIDGRKEAFSPPVAARSFFLRSGVMLLMALMFMSDIATGVDVLLTAFLVDAGYSAVRATFLLNTLALAITVPVTFLTGQVLQYVSTEKVLGALLIIKAAIFVTLGVGGFSGPALSAGLAVAAVVAASAIAIAYWQIYMRFSSPNHAATDIGFMTSIRVVFLMIGGIGAGQVSGALGYAGIFTIAAALATMAAAFAFLQLREKGLVAVP